MPYSQTEIDAKARAMADLITQAVFDPVLVEPAWEAYRSVREELIARDLDSADASDVLDDCSIKRLLFEVIGFAAFIIMGQELPKYLRRKTPLGEEEPDVEWIRYFNTQFLHRIGHHLESSGFTRLREVTLVSIQPQIRFSEGEPLDVVRRVSGYLRAGSAVEAAQDFSQNAALAMDAQRSSSRSPFALSNPSSVSVVFC